MEQVNKQAGKRNIDGAIEILKQGYKYKWIHPFVKSQIDAQIGTMYYYKKDYDNAFEYLKKGLSSHYIAKGMLAIIYMKKKNYDKMIESFEIASKAASKESLIWALYAYCLNKIGKREDAIAVINRGLKKLPDDERLLANLKALQNRKPMKMKLYGEMWLQFMLDRMPVVKQNVPQFARQRMKRR
jgi:tetratricopeptide (TPR) repeat protein